MKTYIALLRGINVSGKKIIPMAALRDLLLKNGLENVQTYIQSGNVVFQSSEDIKKTLETTIHNAIQSQFGFEVPVLIITPKELQYVFDKCPFPEEEKVNSYFMLPYNKPNETLVEEVSKLSYPNETFTITDNAIYFHSWVGYGKAKCSNNFFERKLKITATARNYKTIVKLLSLSVDN
ncbi:MAG: DUF1697 domain-containing protein [Algibacter sp.]|uniref:DUF1697 domain-containing protein n=1 Tax=Algibacter sp. TaxID=1872428 RepID=UPI00329811A6